MNEQEQKKATEKKKWNAQINSLVNTLEEMTKNMDEANAELAKLIEGRKKKRIEAKKG